MEINKINNTMDICKLLGIDYSEKTIRDIDNIIVDHEEWTEFENAFTDYFSEHGLGGDDKFQYCISILEVLLKDAVIYKPGDVVRLQGNSGRLYEGTILESYDQNKFKVKIDGQTLDVEADFIKSRVRKAQMRILNNGYRF